MDDLLKRANANRQHADHATPKDTKAVLADIAECLGEKEDAGNGKANVRTVA